jgi:hypothetical protein
MYKYIYECCNVGTLYFWLRYLDMAKLTTLTPVSLLILCKLSFSIVILKMSSLPTLALNSPMVFREFMDYMFQFLIEAVSHIINFIRAWTLRTMIWNQYTLIIMYGILSLTDSTLLTADMILLCTKILYPIHSSHSPFNRKMYIILLVWCHCPCIWTPALPLNLTYIWTVPSKLSLGSPPYTFYVPHSKSHVHIPLLGLFVQRIRTGPRLTVTSLLLMVRGC